MDNQKISELLVKLILLSRQESVHPVRRSAAADAAYLYSDLITRDKESKYFNQIKADFISVMKEVKYDSSEYIMALNEIKADKQYEMFQ